jgi:cytochrome c-type biogenesis protein CcmH
MQSFLVIAAVMAVIASSAVAIPLFRDRQSRLLAAAAAVVVIAAAAGLYPLWSNWDWHAPLAPQSAAGPEVAAMVAKLEAHLRETPNDAKGWSLLGRSYLALERPQDAVDAYDQAYRLDKSAEAALGLGEALSLRAGGEITVPAAQLFEQALVLAPSNPKALLYGGFAAASRGDRALARTRWQALKDLRPPPQIAAMLDARIAELGPIEGAMPGSPGTSASGAGTRPSAGGSAQAQVDVTISITAALKSRLKPETPLFVFAREPGSHGPPLAAKRLTGAAIGTKIHLSASDSMMPGHSLIAGQRVTVTARVSFSGAPTPVAGDLFGELSYGVGTDGARDLVIDQVTE